VARDKKLGRGLASLLSQSEGEDLFLGGQSLELSVGEIEPNPFQPRDGVAQEPLEQLVDSVRQHGVLQPVVVRRAGEGYQVVAGERRWRAAQQAGLATIPTVVRDVSDDDMLVLALVENIQREDLNPIEKARAFEALIDQLDLTQEQAAKRLGMSRPAIANFLRLLDLPKSIQENVSRGTIAMGHARALLALPDRARQEEIAARIVRQGLSVRQVERLVGRKRRGRAKREPGQIDAHLRDLEDKLRLRLGTKVTIVARGKKGKIIIEFHNDDGLQRVLDVVGV